MGHHAAASGDRERICQGLKSFRLVTPIIRHHHKRLDGSSYPDGLVGDAIPLTARVLQVVDVYDALITERPYKPAFSTAQALETLRAECAKGWRDPDVVARFEQLVLEGQLAWEIASDAVRLTVYGSCRRCLDSLQAGRPPPGEQ
ncbi:MAG: hypothetical protein IH965_04455 [Gemmatimonadetes bacterium]|nr:hypothetical protein [Gemmatimonadota bacterium]